MDLRTRIEDLYNAYQSDYTYIQVARDGTDYVLAVSGSFYNRGKYKFRTFDENGNLKSTTGWLDSTDAENQFTRIFNNRPFPSEGVDNTPYIIRPNPGTGNPPPPPTPPSGPNLDTITGNYSTIDGYGEVDIKAAIEYVTEDTLVDVAPVNRDYLEGDNPNPVYWQDQLDRANAPEAWNAGYEGQGIVVAVIDTGIDLDHVDLDDNLWVNTDEIAGNGIDDDGNGFIDDVHGWNSAEESNDIQDEQGHGTHVSGIIAAEDNGIGVIGVAPRVQIMTLVPFQDFGGELGWRAYSTDIAESIYYATDNGADVINMSLGGGYTPATVVMDAIDYATANGVVVVMAAGNDFLVDPENAVGPAAPGVYASEAGIVVGSLDRDGNMSDFSNRAGGATDWNLDGADVPLYLTANGQVIYSTSYTGSYELKQGTSMACPVVAAAVAVLLSAQPNLTPEQVRVVLANTTK